MTETQTAPTTTQTPAAPPQDTSPLPASEATTDVEGDLDQRADALLAKLSAESKASAREAANEDAPPAEEPATDDVAVKAKAPPASDAAVTAKTSEQIATERRARLDAIEKMADEERTKVAAKRARAGDEPQRQAPVAAAPPPAAPLSFDPKDPSSVFRFIEAQGIPPAAVADWLSTANDPAHAAELAAKKTLSPLEAKLQEIAEQQKRLEQSILQRDQQAYETQLIEQNRQVLVRTLDSVKSEAPLASRFYAKSPAKFMAAVDSVCTRMPEGFTAQDVIDQIEENLSDLQLTEVATTPSTKRKEPAAAKANVGNRLAAERASQVDEDEEPSDLEERARKLKARLAAAG